MADLMWVKGEGPDRQVWMLPEGQVPAPMQGWRLAVDQSQVAQTPNESKNKSVRFTIADVGPDTPVVVNENGGGQSHVPYRFDLLDPASMFQMTRVLAEGADKYGANNWRKIPVEDHLNHLIIHAYAYLAGDRSDEHLAHALCRAMFAQAVANDDKEQN